MKKVISIISVVLIVLGWAVVAKDIGGSFITYEKNIAKARESVEGGLYEQGVEYYNKALKYKDNKKLYLEIKNAYDLFYKEQDNNYSYNRYISALETCCEKYRKNAELWDELITEYYNNGDYDSANSAINKAKNNKVTSENIQKIAFKVENMYDVDFQSISSYKIGKNKTYSVTNGNEYWITDFNWEKTGITYKFVGPLNEEGKGVFVDNSGSTIRDSAEITRVKISDPVTESGYFNSGLVPVKVGKNWIYLKADGTEAGFGEFEMAGSMCSGMGAVQKDGKWMIINSNGESVGSGVYEEIALDKFGCHTDGEKYLAKKDGKYGIYSVDGSLISALDAEEVNVGNFSDPIAFKSTKNEKWGFVDSSGNVVIEPKYDEAKGFSNGFAGVANSEGLWGFINSDNKLAIDNAFYYVGYFTSNKSCPVSRTEGAMGNLTFRYQ